MKCPMCDPETPGTMFRVIDNKPVPCPCCGPEGYAEVLAKKSLSIAALAIRYGKCTKPESQAWVIEEAKRSIVPSKGGKLLFLCRDGHELLAWGDENDTAICPACTFRARIAALEAERDAYADALAEEVAVTICKDWYSEGYVKREMTSALAAARKRLEERG